MEFKSILKFEANQKIMIVQNEDAMPTPRGERVRSTNYSVDVSVNTVYHQQKINHAYV
jgi:outer membrane lipoprotein SlyB